MQNFIVVDATDRICSYCSDRDHAERIADREAATQRMDMFVYAVTELSAHKHEEASDANH
jgi:hypothetical protein